MCWPATFLFHTRLGKVTSRASGLILGTLICSAGSVSQTNTSQSAKPQFEVASIRPGTSGSGWSMRYIPDGLIAKNASLRYVIQDAFGIYDDERFVGGPSRLLTLKFTILAKYDLTQFPRVTLQDRREMLLNLLETRFQFKYHSEVRPVRAYALVARGTTTLRRSGSDSSDPVYGQMCHWTDARPGLLHGNGCSMADLALILNSYMDSGYTVVDETGLTGRYDFELRWQPDAKNASDLEGTSDSDLPSALHQELGLALKSVRTPMTVIDHLSMPSPN